MLKFIFLDESFYKRYTDCPELETKVTRPYAQVQIEIDGILYGVPLRSHIKHPHVLWTNKEKGCGLDFSKAVVIPGEEYISSKKPYIRPDEFEALRGKDYVVVSRMRKYLNDYKRAKERPDIERNARLLKYSSLQYFESELGLS